MKILFLCVANSARSQMAEGLARRLFLDDEIQSAGSQPASVNPYAVIAMKEIGIDISTHDSKSINDLSPNFLESVDYIITLCDQEVCPVILTSGKKLHWPHFDPANQSVDLRPFIPDEQILHRFREVRDAIYQKLKKLHHEIKSEITGL